MPKHSLHIHGTLEERFWPKVDKTPGHGPTGDCWIWTGAKLPKGYGKINDGAGHTPAAHRAAWFLTHGEYPALAVLHRCDNPPCCNPAHLFLGTLAENNEDMRQKGRKWTKLSDEQVSEIKHYLAHGVTMQTLADDYSVSKSLIDGIRYGRCRKHVKYVY